MANAKRKCKQCKEYVREYIKLPAGVFCTIDHALTYANTKNVKIQAKAANDAAKQERKELRARREAIKPKSKWLSEAQIEFNKFIRFRDHDKPCISCGRVEVELTIGGQWDAGHYLSRGAYPELRFEELNCHKQCKSCNAGSGKYTKKNRTVQNDFRDNLIIRIGQEKVDWLEGPHKINHYTIDYLKILKIEYRKKWRELENIIALGSDSLDL